MTVALEKDSCLFIDTGVIIGYAAVNAQTDSFSKKCKDFFETYKENKIITCKFIVDKELPKLRERRRILREEIRIKLWDPGFEIGRSDKLTQRDINQGNRLYDLKKLKGISGADLFQLMDEMDTKIEQRIDYIIDTMISETVIEISDIDESLKNHIHTAIDNWSDSKVISSAIQHHTDGEEIIVITTDKNDFGEIETHINQDSDLAERYNVPVIHYILDVDTG
jgi:hypothetical protein